MSAQVPSYSQTSPTYTFTMEAASGATAIPIQTHSALSDGPILRFDNRLRAVENDVAASNATIDTIRAEIRAGAAETREADNTSAAALRMDFQTLRADTNKDVLGVKLWVLGGVVVVLVGVISYVAHVANVVHLIAR